MSAQLIKVCSPSDIPDGEMVEMPLLGAETTILLVRVHGVIRAFQSKCTHMDIPLCHGAFDGEISTCLEHLWQFDATSGAGIDPEDTRLQQHNVSVINSEVFVEFANIPLQRSACLKKDET